MSTLVASISDGWLAAEVLAPLDAAWGRARALVAIDLEGAHQRIDQPCMANARARVDPHLLGPIGDRGAGESTSQIQSGTNEK